MEHTCEGVMTRLVVCLLPLLCCTVSLAGARPVEVQGPIPFRGIIIDTDGQPVVDAIAVVFAVYVAPVGGASLWLEVQTVQPDTNGRYQVLLGSVTALPRNLFASERQLWLSVQPAGQRWDLEEPRVRFTPGMTTTTADEAGQTGAQPEPAPDQALRVFVDCPRCDNTYLRQQITYLNYVVDRQDAQVHVLVTTQATGGGTEFTFAFIGLEGFAGRDDEVRYVSSSTDTADERREGIAQTLQLGLLRYLAGTPLATQVQIVHHPDIDLGPARPEDDPWNFWVFRASADGSISGQSSETDRSIAGSFSASRTTEGSRIRLRTNSSHDRSDFDLGDGTTFVSTFRDFEVTALLVKSAGDHWGFGVVGSAIFSSFLNLDLTYRAAPALEYDVFPYSEWTRRRLTFTYAVGLNAFDYEEPTIFDKVSEVRLDQMFRLSFDTTQPWGQSSVAVEMSNFLVPLKDRCNFGRFDG